jgi:uncharacterized Tic20 family protein
VDTRNARNAQETSLLKLMLIWHCQIIIRLGIVLILTNTIKNIMAIKKERDREDLLDRVRRAVFEHITLCVIIMLILGLLLIVVGYCIPQTKDTCLALSFISIGSSLIGIGLVSIVFRAASVRLLEEEMLKKTVKTSLEEMEHTYIPKMFVKSANVSVSVETSDNNHNIPKMVIHEEKTLKNLHEIPVKRKKVDIDLYKNQSFKLKRVEVDIKDKKSEPKPIVKHFQIKLDPYLFSIAAKFEDVLNNGNISGELKDKFKNESFSISENAIVTREDDDEWVITDESKFIVRKENGRLNIYSDTPEEEEYTENYRYNIPFVSWLNKGDEVSITEDYEWSPCKAKPNAPNDWDEFAYRLEFPAAELVIKLIAKDNYYFSEIAANVTDWSANEIHVKSSPMVEEEGLTKNVKWKLALTDLTHLNIYEIRFRLGIKD